MTLEQALTLPAGLELDTVVHQMVFGEAPCKCMNCTAADRFGYERYRYHGAPEYSTHLLAAWLVVEEMGERQFSFQIGRIAGENADEWCASFRLTDDWVGCTGEAPRAICRAALAVCWPKEEATDAP